MENNDSKAIKSGFWYTISNFAVKAIGLITTPIFARLLTHSEFGIYNNYTSWLSIVLILVTMQLESTLISARFDFEKELDRYILSMLVFSAVITSSWLLVINLFMSQVSRFTGLNPIYINVMLVYLMFLPGVSFFQIKESYLFHYKKTVITSLVLSLATAGLSVVLVLFMTNRISGRIYGEAIPTILIGLTFCIYFIVKGKRINIFCWKYALPIALPFIPHLLSMTMLNTTDRIMINKICGPDDAALYSLAYSCGALITILITSINGAFAPWLGEKLHQGKFEDIRIFSKYYMFGFLFFAIGFMLVSPEILLVMGGKTYLESRYVMTPVTMGCVCQFLYTMFVNIEQFKKKTIGMAIASVIAALLNFGLNLLFIPKYGYIVAAFTTLIGYLALLVMHMFLVYKMGYNKSYNYIYVITTVIIGCICMVIISLVYDHIIIRYSILAVYLIAFFVVVFKFKGLIIGFFKQKG